LTPKTFDLLLAFLERPGQLLEKEFLLKTVWPDSFVEESNLADNIFRLRKALSNGENGQKFIETVPKHGYRFVAIVKEMNGAERVVSSAPTSAEGAARPPAGIAAPSGLLVRPRVFLGVSTLILLAAAGIGLHLF